MCYVLYFYLAWPTPFVSDVVFCTDSFGTPVTVPDIFLSSSKSAIKQPLPIDTGTGPLQWHVLVIGGKNNFIRGTSRVRGQVHMKMRQLKTLGYSVCLVSHHNGFLLFKNKKIIIIIIINKKNNKKERK